MFKTVCCCFCIRRKSKATVAPGSSGVSSGSKTGRLLIQTAPGRFISVTTLMANRNGPNCAVRQSDLRPQRNGCGSANKKKRKANDSNASDAEQQKMVNENGQESDSTDQGRCRTMVVVVDVERPKTGDTISSRVSLPPLRSSSPVVTCGNIKKIRWNLRRRQTKAVDVSKSISASSISTTMFGADSEDGQTVKAEPESAGRPRQESWKDEIVTLPGTAEADRTADSGCVEGADFQRGGGNAESNVVLFFIHGVGGNSAVWTDQMKFFREIGYNVVALDLIGHGNSNAPRAKSAYTFESIKSDILSLFDRFARDKNVVIAHSYGTCFAAVLARERREKVSHLVLISSGAPVPLDSNDGAFALPTAFLALLRPALSRTFMKLAFLSTPTADDFASSFGAVKTGALKRIMQGQRWSDCTYLYHQQIRSPTLLIYGSGDGLVSLDEMHEMRKAIPGAVLEVVDQAAHMVMLEQPAHVNRLIEAFLRKTARTEENEEEEDVDEERTEAERACYREKRSLQRPTTATSRTIPPSNIFKIHAHESMIGVNSRTVAVS